MSVETLSLPVSGDVLVNNATNTLTSGSRILTFDVSGLSADRTLTVPNTDAVLPIKSGTDLILGSSTGSYGANCIGIGYNMVYHSSASNVILLGTGATSTQNNSLNIGSQYTGLYVPGLPSDAGTHQLFFNSSTGKITYGALASAVYNGTVDAPGLAFANDLDTGFYKSTNLYLSTGAQAAASFTDTAIKAAYATPPSYTFISDPDTGLGCDGTKTSIYAGGTEMLRFHESCTRIGSLGTASAPSISFLLDTDTGIYSAGNKLNFSTGGIQKMQIDTSLKAINYKMTNNDYITDSGSVLLAGHNNAAVSVSNSVVLNKTFVGSNFNYTFVGKLLPITGGQFGAALAASNDALNLIVGCTGEAAVYIYTRSTTSAEFSLSTRITNSGQFGCCVAMSGDGQTVAIGDTTAETTYVYSQASGTWLLTASLSNTASAFSCQLDYYGNTLAVGAPTSATNVGGVYMYSKTSGSWVQIGSKLTPSDNTGASQFGYAIKLMQHGRKFYASGPTNNTNAGAVWIFTYNDSAWTQSGSAVTRTGVTGDYYGYNIEAGEDFLIMCSGPLASSRHGHLFSWKDGQWLENSSQLTLSAGSYLKVAASSSRILLSNSTGMSLCSANGITVNSSFGTESASICLPCDEVIISGAPNEDTKGAVYYYQSETRIAYMNNGLKASGYGFKDFDSNSAITITSNIISITQHHKLSTDLYEPNTDNVITLGTTSKRFKEIYCTNTITTSDRRLKFNIKKSELGLDFLLKLRPVKYSWLKSDEKNKVLRNQDNEEHYGFLAQEVDALLQLYDSNYDIVSKPIDGPWGIRYEQFLPIIVNALKELSQLKVKCED